MPRFRIILSLSDFREREQIRESRQREGCESALIGEFLSFHRHEFKFMRRRRGRQVRDFLIDGQRMLDQEANHPFIELVSILFC